jgi:hypothetical protein
MDPLIRDGIGPLDHYQQMSGKDPDALTREIKRGEPKEPPRPAEPAAAPDPAPEPLPDVPFDQIRTGEESPTIRPARPGRPREE